MMKAVVLVAAAALCASCVRTVVIPPLENVAVRGFVAHAERDWPGTAAQKTLTTDTLDWLAMAVESLVKTKQLSITEFSPRLREFRAAIEEVAAGNPQELEQTLRLRRTFEIGAALIADLIVAAGLERSGDGYVSEIRDAAGSLDAAKLPHRQPEAIEQYLERASEALQEVDRRA